MRLFTHGNGFLLRDMKEWSVKLRKVFLEEVASLGIKAALSLGVWVIVGCTRHAIRGDWTPSIPTSRYESPEVIKRTDLARKTTGHAHDRNGDQRAVRDGHYGGRSEELEDWGEGWNDRMEGEV